MQLIPETVATKNWPLKMAFRVQLDLLDFSALAADISFTLRSTLRRVLAARLQLSVDAGCSARSPGVFPYTPGDVTTHTWHAKTCARNILH